MSANHVTILVLYDSLTCNSENTARLIAERTREVVGVEVRLKKIAGEGELKATPDDVLWADGIAVGSPTNMGVISP